MKKTLIWFGALVLGGILGALGVGWMNDFFNFVASAYTRLFQFVAVPTIALAVATTLAGLGEKKGTGWIFLRTITYTLLTTFAATMVGLGLYLLLQPGSAALSAEAVAGGATAIDPKLVEQAKGFTVYGHILNTIPNNIVAPFVAGNVLSILFVAASVGVGLAVMPESANKKTLVAGINGLQELFFTIIKGLVWALPIGIVAFAAQLSAQIAEGQAVGSVGKYLAVVVGGNVIQFFVVLPLFLLLRGRNPLKVFRAMLPAVMMALFTKSSAATLPVTVASAENNLKAKPQVARFILPMCCTINMNGCAAFIYVTSLFVMQLGGVTLTPSTYAIWSLIAVISAVGNAGVPMGCYFLTLSLMAGMGMPIGILGVILPFYAVIDMIETAENVWSDSCVCAIVDKETQE